MCLLCGRLPAGQEAPAAAACARVAVTRDAPGHGRRRAVSRRPSDSVGAAAESRAWGGRGPMGRAGCCDTALAGGEALGRRARPPAGRKARRGAVTRVGVRGRGVTTPAGWSRGCPEPGAGGAPQPSAGAGCPACYGAARWLRNRPFSHFRAAGLRAAVGPGGASPRPAACSGAEGAAVGLSCLPPACSRWRVT